MSLGLTDLQHLQVCNSQDQSGRCQVPLERWEMRPRPAPEATGGHPSALTSRVSQEGCLKTELGGLCCHSNREGSQGWQASCSGKDASPKGRNILPRVPVTAPLRNTRPAGFSKHCLSTTRRRLPAIKDLFPCLPPCLPLSLLRAPHWFCDFLLPRHTLFCICTHYFYHMISRPFFS